MIANTPKPPYYAVIFSNVRTEIDEDYNEMAEKMVNLAMLQDGYLGIESVRNGLGITISYWKDTTSILKWKQNAEHLMAQQLGKEKWYAMFKLRVAKIERDYDFFKIVKNLVLNNLVL